MEIKTKFDVGDQVWQPKRRRQKEFRWCVDDRPMKITRINISAGSLVWEKYRLKGVLYIDHRPEDLFATQAEAQAECDRRNVEEA